MTDYDETQSQLDDIGLPNYESIGMVLNQPEMTSQKTKSYLKNVLKNASIKRNQLKGYKATITKKFNNGEISEAVRQENNKRIDNARRVLNEYIGYYDSKVKSMKGSGINSRKHRGGNIMFFNNPNELLKKLEVVIGSKLAGNTSIDLRNTGVNILNTLLKLATINRSQYNKLYKKYFNI